MLRMFVGGLVALVLSAGSLLAGEFQGKITSVDAKSGQLSVKVGAEEKRFQVSNETQCMCPFGMELKEGLKVAFLFKAGATVKVTTATRDGKEVVTRVQAVIEKQ